ncbi:uncharacterized protein [Montipora foliosa]|uniref:uncharacterized protein isoform X3 n=1 Tax=Montipora foliosa TaxID=591990 RepID=UPI0035F1A49C
MASVSQEYQGYTQGGGSGKVKVTILASEWGSSKGGLSTINRKLAIQLAKSSEVEITFFVPQCSKGDKKEALSHKINIVEAKKFVGFEDLDLLSSPPDDLLIEVVIGHGAELGRHAQVIRNRHKCKWVQVVHTDSEELGMFNSYPDAISKGQEKHYIEVKLCEEADFVVTIGPKLAESFRRYLQSCKNHQTIFDFTPGIFEEFLSVDQGLEERKHCTVLVFGRGDAEDFQLKGFDIVGKAVASLADTHLIFVGAPDGKKQEMAQLLLKCDLPAHCLKVRGYVKCRESLRKLFCEVDLVVMPSRTDGFGLTGLEALSAGLPVLVSKNSGFGESLSKVPFGSSFVIDSEKPEVWAAAIKTIWDKERQSRLEEVQALRSSYERKYSWTKQSDALLVKIINLVRARLRLQIDCEAITRASAQTGMGTAVTPQQPQEVTQGAREVPSSSNKQHAVVTPTFAPEIELYGGIDTQTVMNIITLKTLQGLDVSIPEQRNQFVLYLERVHKALIVDAKSKCLLITVEVSSLQSLEDLWEDYSLGHVNKMAQKLLVTKELLEEFGLLEVKLTTFIAEEEYRACQEYFSVESSTWFTFETMAVAGEARLSIQETRNSAAEGNLSPPIQATDPVESSSWFTFETMAGTGRNEEELGRTRSSEPIPIPLDNLIDILRKLSELPQAFPHFVRRQKDELSNILTCLRPDNECQCVLLHGAPGIGKTTLAIKAANEILETNDRALVVYINCKYIYSFADFSEKVIRQIYPSRFPANNPEAEVKNRLITLNKTFFVLLLLDNFEFLLGNANDNEQENQRSAASLCPADSKDRRLIKDFIGEIAGWVRNVKLLVTSSNIVCFRQIGIKTMTLDPFSPEETFELLKNVHGDRVTVETSKELCEACNGIPLVLYTLMSSAINLPALVAYMNSSSPHDPAINKSLDYCFSRLRTQEQHTLLSLALVRGWFTLPKVAKAFCSATSSERDIKRHVVELGNCSLLQQNMFGETCRYTFLSNIRDYCIHKAASEEGFRVVFRRARNLLIDYLISFLKDTLKKFLSKDAVESAIDDFAYEKENVIQLVGWIDSGEVDAERVTKCIDAFNVAGELLAKMMAKSMFKGVYESLVRKCEEMGEQRRLGECLTSLGIKEIFNCTCTEGLCDKATARAQHYLEKANTIQSKLGMNHGNSRAQCLAKLGRCLAKSSDTRERGRGMIEDAIRIRQNAVKTPDEEEGGENVCHVMLGATFNDKAVALSLENRHRQAVTIREEKVLPIYIKRLGDHPFTATILNHLSNNHRDLKEIEAAERYVRKALEIRRKLLGDHRDTAKSLFDLGMVLKEKGEFQEAKTYLEKCKEMQEKVANDDPIFVQQTQQELEAVYLELGESPDPSPQGLFSSRKMTNPETCESQLPREASSEEATQLKRGAKRSEGVLPTKTKKKASLWTKKISMSSVITSEGGGVVGEGVKLVCPPGAVERPVTVTVTLEDPSKYCGLLVQSDLENDVMFCAPIINLQPNGHHFKTGVELTVRLKGPISSFNKVVILHGKETALGGIAWEDITRNTIESNETSDEVLIITERFSIIAALIKRAVILTKDIASRLNLSGFNFSLLVLLNSKSVPKELAVVFVSEDVENEAFFQKDETSLLVQLKKEGFREIFMRPVKGQDDRRIYNQEELKVSVFPIEDFKCSSSELPVVVESSTWWSTGHAIRLQLESSNQDRIVCGRITVKGKYGSSNERQFCDLDLHGYIKRSLRVNREVFNVIPIAKALKLPEELLPQIKEKWSDDDCQLEVILNWLKQTDVLEHFFSRGNPLESLKQDYRVTTKRGQIHVKHIRYVATKIDRLEHESVELEKHFASKIHTLCQLVLRDCCLEMESTGDGLAKAASSKKIDERKMPECLRDFVVFFCKDFSSSSEKCIIEEFQSVVPELIQMIKEVFVDNEADYQEPTGLWGLSDEALEAMESSIRDSLQHNNVLKLICDVSQVLEKLCLENCSYERKSEFEKCGKRLANQDILEFLKPYFQNCPKNWRLHKRLELFSERTRDILSNPMAFADDFFMRDFANVAMSLNDFAKFDASKLVRFELTDSSNSRVNCSGENTQYHVNQNRPVFYQEVVYEKEESEDELKLHASAIVHMDGKIHKIGAFQSVIMLHKSCWESFEKCISSFRRVATAKVEDEDSDNRRVVLYSSQKQELSEMLKALGNKMGEELVGFTNSQVTQCPLTARNNSAKKGNDLRLRLIYKWGSDSLDLESKDFVACDDSSAQSASLPELQLFGVSNATQSVSQPFPSSFIIQGGERVEYHVHYHNNTMQGHINIVGNGTSLNNQLPAQGAIKEA